MNGSSKLDDKAKVKVQETKNGLTADLYEIQDLNCPVCGKTLTSDEYIMP